MSHLVKAELRPLDADYKTDVGHGNSSEPAYSVEARINSYQPDMIGKQIFDNRWRKANFELSTIGVPAGPSFSRANDHRLLGHSAAQALRWWLHAVADAEHKGYCLETRLVEHRLTSSYKVEATGTLSHYPPVESGAGEKG